MDYKEVDLRFLKIFDNIDNIMSNEFYKDKGQLLKVREIFEQWYEEFKLKKTLKTISVKELEYLDLEITDIFDMYISTEPVKSNYAERLLFNLDILKEMWKEEMLGGKINVK